MRLALCLLLATAPAVAHADDKTEWSILPVAGGNSDIGVGAGQVSSVARTSDQYKPYLWRVETAGMITFRGAPGGGVDVPYQDYYAKVTLPHVLPGKLRLELRPSFTWLSTLRYYGLGNDSPEYADRGQRYIEFGRIHPTMRATARVHATDRWHMFVGNAYTHNWIELHPNSKLAEDMTSGSPEVKRLVGNAESHGVLQFEYGVVYDHRDDETAPTRGMFHQALLQLAPGGADPFPYKWARQNTTFRFYVPLFTPRLVLAMRAVVDLLFGDPPFYELARFEDTFAIGGANGVRGVPAQRYHGKVKMLGNVELRAEVFQYKSHRFGLAAFVDAGRLWTDFKPHPALDGTGIGIKYGVGGGIRWRIGETFLVRADVAWSPDARPIGGYFSAGHMF